MLASHLTYLIEAQQPADLRRLAEHLPYEWIERAVQATGTASIRRRRLPAEQVVWLVIALAMYRHWSISEVLDSLDLALPNEAAPFVSKSAVAQARQRIGEAPMAWLFEQTARAWTTQDAAHHAFKGLSLWAMDGTTLRTPDSAANREHFGAQGYASGKVASYPQVRAVTLTAIPTHLVADINFGRYDTNEMVYAKSLLPQIPEDSLTVFDRGFLAAEILCGLTMNARNRHFLIPAKANTCWEVISGTAD
ncbi:IS4 family transposase, partial [Caballeronia choica]|uniref:IS4 family transposase n=1 Tax=Caballeronia choica TaxID=326476 RepID=UPI000A44AC0B